MACEQRYREQRQIDPSAGLHLADGSPNNDNRIEIGPTRMAFTEWQEEGLRLPDLGAMRKYR